MTKTYELGGVVYSRWSDVQEHARTILHGGCRTLRGADLEFVKDLINYHPHADKKLKHGVVEIRVTSPEYGSHFCFAIVDSDGDVVDFSYKKCRASAPQERDRVKNQDILTVRTKAYRGAIQPQIEEFYRSDTLKRCVCCGTKFELQVDHKSPSFMELVNHFEAINTLPYPPVKRTNANVQTVTFNINTRERAMFVETWQLFHRHNAKLQYLCVSCNLSKSGRVRYAQRSA